MKCIAILDLQGVWGSYVRTCSKELTWFKRDPIAANPGGEEMLGRIRARYVTPDERSPDGRAVR